MKFLEEQSIKRYLSFCKLEKRLDLKTLKAYRGDLYQFSSWLSNNNSLFDSDSLHLYIIFLNSQYAVSSVKRKFASLKAFANYLEENELQDNPFRGFRLNIKDPRILPKTISTEELNKTFRALYRNESVDSRTTFGRFQITRDRVVFELLISTGLRVSELCSLNKENVCFSSKTIRVLGKYAKERIIQIENEHTLAALCSYIREASNVWPSWANEKNGSLLLNRLGERLSDQSVRLIINKWAKASEVSQNITPHMFRHTFATLLLENGVDIRYIQRFLGHSSIKTTEIYTYVSSEKMRVILKTCNPRSSLCINS